MRGVIVLVGALAVIAVGLTIASTLVEPAPASGGGRTVRQDLSDTTDEHPGSHAPIAPPAANSDGGALPDAPSELALPPTAPPGSHQQAKGEPRAESESVVPATPTSPLDVPAQLADAGSRYVPPDSEGDSPRSPERSPSAKTPTTHRGPEPAGDDPCVVPIYYDWFERRVHLTPADHGRLTVRVTVENYTTPWWLRPDVPGKTFLWAVEGDVDAKRIQHGENGALSVKFRSVRLGTRVLKDLELPLQMTGHPTGGVFGARLLDAFDVTVDYERGVLAFNDCR